MQHILYFWINGNILPTNLHTLKVYRLHYIYNLLPQHIKSYGKLITSILTENLMVWLKNVYRLSHYGHYKIVIIIFQSVAWNMTKNAIYMGGFYDNNEFFKYVALQKQYALLRKCRYIITSFYLLTAQWRLTNLIK